MKFIEGNFFEKDLSDGTVFYMFRPVPFNSAQRLKNTLEEVAKQKPIQVVTLHMPEYGFSSLPWLKEKYSGDMGALKVYQSI